MKRSEIKVTVKLGDVLNAPYINAWEQMCEKYEINEWCLNENGVRRDWDYVQESVIASGFTEKELIDSAKEYVRLCGMTWEEYFADLREKKHCR